MFHNNAQHLVGQLREDLLKARKARDSLTSTTLQVVISAIDNAGAIPVTEYSGSLGVGSTEAPRRELSEQDLQQIIQHEIIELRLAIKQLGDAKNAYTDELNKKIIILESYLNVKGFILATPKA